MTNWNTAVMTNMQRMSEDEEYRQEVAQKLS